MSTPNPKVDAFLQKAKKWPDEMAALRAIALDCQLAEDVKWRFPCYSLRDSNVVLIQAFKDYCALLFFKGALLKDPQSILVRMGENTQAARQARFDDVREITKLKAVLKAYIKEAIDVEKAGLKVTLKKEYAIPEELQTKLDESPALKKAFEALTPGRQRAYLLHFAAPKQSKTRASRVAKCVPQILNGKGLDD